MQWSDVRALVANRLYRDDRRTTPSREAQWTCLVAKEPSKGTTSLSDQAPGRSCGHRCPAHLSGGVLETGDA